MKTVKKLLSVVLACALVVGTIVIAANAQTAFDDTQLTYTLTADKTTLAPGDTVTVTLRGTTNYVMGAALGAAMVYDSTYVEALKTTYGNAAGFSNNGVVFPDGSPLNDLMSPTFNINSLAGSFPTGYTIGTWKLVKMNTVFNPDYFDTSIQLNNTPIYSITFKILAAAPDGTAVIKLDPAFIATEENTDSDYCTYVMVADDTEYLNSGAYLNAKTVDVSGAALSLTVSGVTDCDYTALETAVANCDTLNPSGADFYDTAKYTRWTTALTAANAYLADKETAPLPDTGTNQADLNAAAVELEAAFAALTPSYVDLTALTEALTTYGTVTPSGAEYYDAVKYQAWQDALAAGRTGKLTTYATAPNTQANRDAIQALIDDITSTHGALSASYVSLTALDAAIADCDTLDPAGEEFYDSAKYSTWQTTLAAANAGLTTYASAANTTANQSAVALLASNLRAAFEDLQPQYVSLAALQQAIADSDTLDPASEDYYDATEYAAWDAALTAANAGLTTYASAANTAANQSAVAALVTALTDAYAALDARYLSTTALQGAIDDFDTVTPADSDYYVAADYAAWQTALDHARDSVATFAAMPDTAANRTAIAEEINALSVAYDALVPFYVDLEALTQAIADCDTLDPASADYYDATEYAAWDSALTAAQAGLTTYAAAADTAANQSAVAALVTALTDAYAALDVRYVSLTALAQAMDDCDTLDPASADYYDEAEYSAWVDALSAAETALATYATEADTTANQTAVAALATALTEAYEALDARYVSYASIEAALANSGTAPQPQNYYTATSYAAWLSALTDATSINTNRPAVLAPASDVAAQAVIDDAAAALNAAFDNLEAGVCHITSVGSQNPTYFKNTFAPFVFHCNVEGVTKIQVIRPDGSTRTYDKNNTAVISVTPDGLGGEDWVINLYLYNDTEDLTAKAKLGKVWDSSAIGFTAACFNTEDAAIRSWNITKDTAAATEFTTAEMVTVTVVTGPSARRIRFISASGATSTYSTGWELNEDGDKVWTIVRRFCEIGENSQTIGVAGSNNRVEATNTIMTFTVKDPRHVPVPPMVDAGITAFSATKLRMLKGATQTLNITTESAATAVRIKDNKGKVISTVKTFTEGTDTREWTVDVVMATPGAYTYIAEAYFDGVWYAYELPVSFVVLF